MNEKTSRKNESFDSTPLLVPQKSNYSKDENIAIIMDFVNVNGRPHVDMNLTSKELSIKLKMGAFLILGP